MGSIIMFIYKKEGPPLPSMLEIAKQLISHDPELRLKPYVYLVQYALDHGWA